MAVGTVFGHPQGTSISESKIHSGWAQKDGVGLGQESLVVVLVIVGQVVTFGCTFGCARTVAVRSLKGISSVCMKVNHGQDVRHNEANARGNGGTSHNR